jgi:adenylate kinase
MTIEPEDVFVSTEKVMPKAPKQSDQSNSRVILFLGAPGSGKGTQSSWLASHLDIPAISTGDMLRSQAKQNTRAGARLREILASGSLVSDEVVCQAVASRLKGDLPSRGIILDGFPRTLKQAVCLDQILEGLGMPRPVVINLHVSVERLLERLTARRQCGKCGAIYNLLLRPSSRGMLCENDGEILVQRADDSDAAILRRLTEFAASHTPLVEYYHQGDYHLVDGDRNPEVISAELLRILGSAQARAAA